MSDLATVIVERHGELQVVHLAGEVDISNAGTLEDHISEAVPNDATGMVLDLSDTGYLDSAGIRMMFELGQRLAGRRQALAVVVPRDSLIRHALVITEVEQALPLYDTLDEAVEALRTG
jgi:anti-sigma B factor antagonist